MAKNKEFEKTYRLEGLKRNSDRKTRRFLNYKEKCKCKSCNTTFNHVVPLRNDPYYSEIYNTNYISRLCLDCYKTSQNDI